MQAAKGLINWIKTGITEVTSAIDAEREARIDAHAARVDAEFSRLKKDFAFDAAVEKLSVSSGDRLAADMPSVAQAII